MNEKAVLSVKEMAAFLGISETVAYRLTHSEGFPVLLRRMIKSRKREKDEYILLHIYRGMIQERRKKNELRYTSK